MMVLIDWLVRGLRKRKQGQLFAPCCRDDASLFNDRGLEGADVIHRHISVVEKTLASRRGTKYRTYFADPSLLLDGLLDPLSPTALQGIS